jgi:hypothetical protein
VHGRYEVLLRVPSSYPTMPHNHIYHLFRWAWAASYYVRAGLSSAGWPMHSTLAIPISSGMPNALRIGPSRSAFPWQPR